MILLLTQLKWFQTEFSEFGLENYPKVYLLGTYYITKYIDRS